MPTRRVLAPPRGVNLLADFASRRRTPPARLLSPASAFKRFGPELARLRNLVDPSVAMTFSPDWWRAVPPPRGYAHRLLLLHENDDLRAAVYLRERTFFGFRTGILYGGDAKGEGLVLCPPGQAAEWLAEGIRALFQSRRCVSLLLHRPAGPDGSVVAVLPGEHSPDGIPRLQCRMEPMPAFWQTRLSPAFAQMLAPLGHRTRRNLRHELRRAVRNGWLFLPELTPAQVAEATEALASRCTHPYGKDAIAARLALERAEPNSFSMGLKSPQGEWLSLLSGVRRPAGVTDLFWQSNVAVEHGSVALSMRALLMRHEGERGSSVVRWIGGTSPFLEHCCHVDPGAQTLITRPGLRLALLRLLFGTRFVSPQHPMQKLLRLEPSGA